MQAVKALVLMQLKNMIDFSFLKSKKSLTFKIIYTVLFFASIIGLFYLAFFLSIRLGILTLTTFLNPRIVVFLFGVMLVFSLTTVTVKLTRNLYFSDDNKMLFTLPVRPNQIFISKLIVYYIAELKKSFTYIVPLFVAFGLVSNYSWLFYIKVIIGFIFISLLIVVIAAILSIPTMLVIMLLKKAKIIGFIIFAGALTGITILVFNLIAGIPANLQIIQNWGTYYRAVENFLRTFEATFTLITDLTYMIIGELNNITVTLFTGKVWATFGILIAVIVVLSALVYFAIYPIFFKMASSTGEYKKSIIKIKHKNIAAPSFLSSIRKELFSSFREPSIFFNNFVFMFILPFAILLLNKVFASMDTRVIGVLMATSANILIMLLILLTNNIYAASLFSSEGKAFYILKAQPASFYKTMLSKLSFNYLLSVISIITACSIMYAVLGLSAGEAILITVIVLAVHTSHILWSVDLDIGNPQHAHYNNGAHTSTNPNEIKSTIIAFLSAFLFFGVALFFMLENSATALLKVMFIALAFLAVRIYLNFWRVRVYAKDL